MRTRLFVFLLISVLVTVVLPGTTYSQIHAWRRSLSSNTNAVGINPLNSNSVYACTGTFRVSYDRGMTWNQRGPAPFDVRQIVVHPADTMVVFIVSFTSGLRRSTDYGMTWNVVIPDFGIDGESITYDPQRPDTMYAGDYEDALVYRSTDRGLSWKFIADAGGDMCTLSVRPDSANILYAGTGNGTISKSTDSGVSWRQVKGTGPEEIPKIVINQSNPMLAYAAGFAGPDSTIGVWKTTDGGEHWALTSLRGISIWALDISASNPDVLYAGTFDDAHNAVYRTTDGGEVWDTLKTGFPANGNSWSLKVDPFGDNNVWLAINGSSRTGIYRWASLRARVQGTVRNGVSGQPATFGSIRLISTGDSIRLDQSGYYSFDYFDGDSAITSFAHVIAYPYYLHDEPLIFALDSIVTHDVYLQELPTASVIGTVRTVTTQQPLQADITLYGSGLGGTIFGSSSTNSSGAFQINNVYISYPPIVKYDSLYIDPVFPYAQKFIKSIQLDTIGLFCQIGADTADVLVVSTSLFDDFSLINQYRGIYREALDSLGLASHIWNRNGRGFASARRANELRKKTAVYYTEGNSFLDTLSMYPPVSDSLVAAINAGVNIFITGQNFVERNDSLARTYIGVHHGGNTSQISARGVADDLFGSMLINTSGLSGANNQTSRDILLVDNPRARTVATYGFFGGQGTAAIRIDSIGGGGKLVLFGFGFEAINSAAARKTVMQRIIGYLDGSIVVNVHEGGRAGTPIAFHLGQNYPNPFNPTTTIRFDVAATSVVSLQVFNLIGQEVATLVRRQFLPGSYAATMDASGIASGIYVYRLRASSMLGQEVFQQTKKLVVVK